MPAALKWSLVAAATIAAVLVMPILIVATLLPSQNTRQFYSTCAQLRGTRADIVANPPQQPLGPDEVLLRITNTATKLGFGRQGATVTVAIALRATGLANAANPAAPTTLRYAHSTEIRDGAGALGLPVDWGSAAELMTPEVSTAIALDRMVDAAPQWRDTDPAVLAAQITGHPDTDYTDAVAAAQTWIPDAPTPAATSSAADLAVSTTSAPATTTSSVPATTPETPTSASAASTPLSLAQASSAAAAAPEAAACLAALTTPIPPPAPGPNPNGPQLAAAAQHAVGTDPRPDANAPTPTAAQLVAGLVTSTTGCAFPDTLPEQLQTGWQATDPAPGDLVFTDISADQGPHLVGIAVDTDTMVTVLPGHPNPEWSRIGPNRLVRRIEVSRTS